MSQDTPYYEFIHGENGIQIPFLKNLYMQVARLVSREIETNRNFVCFIIGFFNVFGETDCCIRIIYQTGRQRRVCLGIWTGHLD